MRLSAGDQVFICSQGTLRVGVRSITIGPASRGRKEFPRPVCQREPRCAAPGVLTPLYAPYEQPSRDESTDSPGDRRERDAGPTEPGIQTECVVLEGLLQHRLNNLFFERHARVVRVRRPGSLVVAISLRYRLGSLNGTVGLLSCKRGVTPL